MHHLHISMRHCDPDFGRLLNVMRKQQPPQELLDQDSSDYVISANDLSSILTRPTVTMLCALKQQVQTNHVDMLYAWFHTPAILNIPIYGSPINISECAKWVADDAFYTLPQVAVGARVTVLENMDVQHATANAVQATVTDFTYNNDSFLHGIIVKLADVNKTLCIRRTIWSCC